MKLNITAKDFDLTDGVKAKVEKKVEKIKKIVDDNADVNVTLSAPKGKFNAKTANISVKMKNKTARASVTTDDMYKSISQATDTIIENIKSINTKSADFSIGLKDIHREMDKMLNDFDSFPLALDIDFTKDKAPKIGRFFETKKKETTKFKKKKYIDATPMTKDDACEAMEFSGHDFYIFRDVENDDTFSIVYQRKDGGKGLIIIE